MAIQYRVYASPPDGSPVDYSAPVGTTSGLAFALPAYPAATALDTTYAVRSYDPATGFEERNTDVVVRVRVDAASADATARPASPVGLGARALASGGCRVTWAMPPTPARRRAATPAGFKVWLTAGDATDYSAPPAATAAYLGPGAHSATLAGLADGVTYVVSVRASNASGDDPGADAAPVVGSAVAPPAVGGLAGSATHSAP